MLLIIKTTKERDLPFLRCFDMGSASLLLLLLLTRTAMASVTTAMAALLLQFLVLLVGQDVLQLGIILLALFHLLLHLSLLLIGQFRALTSTVTFLISFLVSFLVGLLLCLLITLLLGGSCLTVRTRTSAVASTTHTRATQHIGIFFVQCQHLRFLVGGQIQFLGHAFHHFFLSGLLGCLTFFLVVVLSYCCRH